MPRDDCVLTLWSAADLAGPVHSFNREFQREQQRRRQELLSPPLPQLGTAAGAAAATGDDAASCVLDADDTADHVKEFAWRATRSAGAPSLQLCVLFEKISDV